MTPKEAREWQERAVEQQRIRDVPQKALRLYKGFKWSIEQDRKYRSPDANYTEADLHLAEFIVQQDYHTSLLTKRVDFTRSEQYFTEVLNVPDWHMEVYTL